MANPVTQPTTLIDFRLDHADPYASAPTGFAVQFSGAISLTNADGKMQPVVDHGLEVVDQNGRAWPVTCVGYSEASSQLTYIFQNQLPAGHYAIRLPRSGGLTDLAGQPLRGQGRDPAMLATFEVPPEKAAADPHEIGPYFPGDFPTGVTRVVNLEPGQTAVFRVVTLTTDFLRTTTWSGRDLALDLIDAQTGVVRSLFSGTSGTTSLQHSLSYLPAGTYLLRLRDRSKARASPVVVPVGRESE